MPSRSQAHSIILAFLSFSRSIPDILAIIDYDSWRKVLADRSWNSWLLCQHPIISLSTLSQCFVHAWEASRDERKRPKPWKSSPHSLQCSMSDI
jgi:hypothetical protein